PPRRSEPFAGDRNDLGGQRGYGFFPAKDQPVARQDVLRSVPFDHTQHLALQEQAAAGSDVVPSRGRQIIHGVGESEAKAGGLGARGVIIPQRPQRRLQSAQRIFWFWSGSHGARIEARNSGRLNAGVNVSPSPE